tara:strand:+ start:111 stop:308 length:198 start_codon:yes stop_codon:yes gene_type:complete
MISPFSGDERGRKNMHKVFSTYFTWLQASQISTFFSYSNRKQKKHPEVLLASDLAVLFNVACKLD